MEPAAFGAVGRWVSAPARLDGDPPSVLWSKEEIAIDAFHHAVYTAATGLAWELIDGRGNGGGT